MASARVARCPTHGLHGEREECFVCSGPVEQVPMVEVFDDPTLGVWTWLCELCGQPVEGEDAVCESGYHVGPPGSPTAANRGGAVRSVDLVLDLRIELRRLRARVPSLEGSGQARKTDPKTARAAGEITVRRGTQRWDVLSAIEHAGEHGATAGELVHKTKIPYASLTPRIGELKRGGFIKTKGEETRPSDSGVAQEVLVVSRSLVIGVMANVAPDPVSPEDVEPSTLF